MPACGFEALKPLCCCGGGFDRSLAIPVCVLGCSQ